MNASRLAIFVPLVVLGFASCGGPAYQEIRRPAPGGGTYIERIRVDRLAKPVRPAPKPRPAPVSLPEAKPQDELVKPAEVTVTEVPKTAPAEVKPETSSAKKPGWWTRLRRSSASRKTDSATESATKPVTEPAVVPRKTGSSWWPFGRRPAEPEVEVSYWRGDGVTGRSRIEIALGEQKLRYYRGGHLVGESPVSTGREGFQTVVGRFAICEKDLDHESSMFGDYVDADGKVVQGDVDARKDPRPAGARFDGADMRWFMRITGATGMHAGYLPGFPASHGCIRLPAEMAEVFYRETPMGTPVEILP